MAMTVVSYIQRSISDVNTTLAQDVKPLTPQQLAWKPAPQAGSIGYIFWHFMRTQDELISGLAKKPSVWVNEKWFEKLGMDQKTSGVGYKAPDIDKAAAMPLATVMQYAERVAANTNSYMESLKDSDLEVAINPERPNRTVVVNLRSFVIAHGWWHDGEIKYLKGLQDMPFAY